MNTFRTSRADALNTFMHARGTRVTKAEIQERFLVSDTTARQMVRNLRDQLADTAWTVVFVDGAYELTNDRDLIDSWTSERARHLEAGVQTVADATQGFEKISATQAVAKLTEV